jgi:uncharacterized protein (TIGR01777 family)
VIQRPVISACFVVGFQVNGFLRARNCELSWDKSWMGITASSVVDAPLDETFAWHARRGAIERLTPPFHPVRVISETEDLEHGRSVLRLPGGVHWVATHEGYDPPHCFIDRLTSLPLRWRHTHRFEQEGLAATRVTDIVETPVPERILRSMFEYRHRQLLLDLETQRAMSEIAPRPLSIGISGSSGLIGRALSALLSSGGHRVIHYVRRVPRSTDERRWRPEEPDVAMFEGVDVVVHLAGASIAGRFTEDHKRLVRESRVDPTARLAKALTRMPNGPRVLVCASAIGIYGADRGNEKLTETSTRGDGTLADLVDDWERALEPAESNGVRVVRVRTGIVQSPRGGMLRFLRPLFLAGAGGRIGSGSQWFSWIDLDDVADIYYRGIVDNRCCGPINAVAPDPVTNQEYAQTLARVLRRPAIAPVPVLFPRLLLGREGADELALASQRVLPGVLGNLGHVFRRTDLEACLRHQLGRYSE